MFEFAPTPEELEQAPIISRWRSDKGMLIGFVYGHPHFEDESYVTTSHVLEIDEEGGWVRTRTQLYRLGVNHGETIN